MIDRLADAGFPVDRCCRVLGVSRQGYYRYKRRPTSATQLRRQWLTGLIREVHIASRGTYGYRRVHADHHGYGHPSLVAARVRVDEPGWDLRTPWPSTGEAPTRGGDRRRSRQPEAPSSSPERVVDDRHNSTPDQRRSRVLCGSDGRLQSPNRRLVDRFPPRQHSRRERARHGYSKPPPQTRRDRPRRPPIESTQFTSWAFSNKIRSAGLMPSFGSVGDSTTP